VGEERIQLAMNQMIGTELTDNGCAGHAVRVKSIAPVVNSELSLLKERGSEYDSESEKTRGVE